MVLKHPKIKIPFDAIKNSTIWTMFGDYSHMDNDNIKAHGDIIDLLLSLYPDDYIEIDAKVTQIGMVYKTNFMNYNLDDLLRKAFPTVFAECIKTYIAKYPLAKTEYKNTIIQTYKNVESGRFNNVNFFSNMICLLNEDKLKNVSMNDFLPTILKDEHLYNSASPNVALWLIKREKIIGQNELNLCIKFCNYDAVEYLIDQKCLVYPDMVDGLIRFIMETKSGGYIHEFPKLIKLLATLTEFSEKTLITLALFNYIPLDDMKIMTTNEKILNIYNSTGRDVNWIIRNLSLSEVKKRIKIESVIKKQTVMTLLYLDTKKQTIRDYILNFQNVEVDLECLVTAKELGVTKDVMKLLTTHYLKQMKSLT
jgi:hypothetical protein